jgi:hypothetical protein
VIDSRASQPLTGTPAVEQDAGERAHPGAGVAHDVHSSEIGHGRDHFHRFGNFFDGLSYVMGKSK